MKSISAPLAAALCVVGFLAWLVSSTRARTADPSSRAPQLAGSRDVDRPSTESPPSCARPIPLRLVELPPWFEISAADVRTAMGRAMALWEEPIGRQLFVIDSVRGLPVRFVYDGRQARTRDRMRMEEELRQVDRDLEVARRALVAAREEYDLAQSGYRRRANDLQQERSSHNATVRRWNAVGGAPDDVTTELEQNGEALLRRGRSLEEEAGELRGVERRLREEEQELARRLADRNEAAEELERRFPPIPVESGALLETHLGRGEETTLLRSEIRIFRFEDLNDLVWILSHELGHVLGLGHAAVPTAVMSAEYGQDGRSPDSVTLDPEDVRLLLHHCAGVLG